VGCCRYREASTLLQANISSLRADPELNPIELGVALLSYGKLCYVMGNVILAKEVLSECIQWKKESSETSRSFSDAYSLLGDILMESSHQSDALENYEHAVENLAILQFNESHLDYRLLAGKIQYLKKDLNRAQHSFELVRLTGTSAPIMSMDQTAYELRRIAGMNEGLGNDAKAIYLLRESLRLTETRPSCLERSWGLIALGNLLILCEGEENEALRCYEEASKIQMCHLGDCGVTNDTVNLIGHALVALEDYDKAIDVFTKNLEKAKQLAADDLERQAGILYLIADASEAKGDCNGAAWHFNQCLGVLRKARTADHPDIAQILERLSHVTGMQGDIDMALAYCHEAVQIRRKDRNKQLLAGVLFEMASLAIRKSDVDTAEKALVESTAVLESQSDDDDDDDELRVTHLVELGRVMVMRRKNDEATKVFTQSAALTTDADIRQTSLLRLAHLKLADGHYDRALLDYQELQQLHRGESASSELAFGMAMAHFLGGRWKEAKDVVFSLTELPSASNYRALSYLLLGDIAESQGERTKAEESWSKGLSSQQQQSNSSIIIEKMFRQRIEGGHGYLYAVLRHNGSQGNDNDNGEEQALRSFVVRQSCQN
jgi:tetratricopeptide (TPR) repeat protein